MPCRRFWVGLNEDASVGVILAGLKQHLLECVAVGAAGGDACVASGLINDQNIAWLWRRERYIESVVLRQFIPAYPLDPRPCTVQ